MLIISIYPAALFRSLDLRSQDDNCALRKGIPGCFATLNSFRPIRRLLSVAKQPDKPDSVVRFVIPRPQVEGSEQGGWIVTF
jgi:hypothetical protein